MSDLRSLRKPIESEDFVLKIEARGESDQEVRLLRSPFGSAACAFRPPFASCDLGEILESLEGAVRGHTPEPAGSLARDIVSRSGGGRVSATPEDVGGALFRSLFDGAVRDTYLRCRGRVESNPGLGLRIRLLLNPSVPELRGVCSLPWELLYEAETRDFLSRSRSSPVVRHLEVPRLSNLPAVDPPWRILVASALPTGTCRIELARELERLREGVGVEIELLERATLAKVHEALLEKPFHGLHFMGHGAFDRETGEGSLLFETSDRRADPVPGRVLAEHLRASRCLRLVFLNACESSRLPRREGQDPFSGVASALVMGGIPAVVGMQFPVSDRAAIAFSQAFYRALAAGDEVDLAVSEGRLAIVRSNRASWEWGTPALFLSAPDARLLTEATEASPYRVSIEESQGVLFGDAVRAGNLRF